MTLPTRQDCIAKLEAGENLRHTLGPWKVKGKQSIRGPKGEYIASANWMNGPNNARLIASTPDLLAALQAVMADCADIDTESCLSPEVGIKVRAALVAALESMVTT